MEQYEVYKEQLHIQSGVRLVQRNIERYYLTKFQRLNKIHNRHRLYQNKIPVTTNENTYGQLIEKVVIVVFAGNSIPFKY